MLKRYVISIRGVMNANHNGTEYESSRFVYFVPYNIILREAAPKLVSISPKVEETPADFGRSGWP